MNTVKQVFPHAKLSILQMLLIVIESKNYLIASTLDSFLLVFQINGLQIKFIEKHKTPKPVCCIFYDKYYKYDLYCGMVNGGIHLYQQFYKTWLQKYKKLEDEDKGEKNIEHAVYCLSLVSKYELVAVNMHQIKIFKNNKFQTKLKLNQSILFTKANLQTTQSFPYLYISLNDYYPPLILTNIQIGQSNLQDIYARKIKQRTLKYTQQDKMRNISAMQLIENFRMICLGDIYGRVYIYQTLSEGKDEFISQALYFFETNEDKVSRTNLFIFPILCIKINKTLDILAVLTPYRIFFIDWQNHKRDRKVLAQKQSTLNLLQWTSKNHLIFAKFEDPFCKNKNQLIQAEVRIFIRSNEQ